MAVNERIGISRVAPITMKKPTKQCVVPALSTADLEKIRALLGPKWEINCTQQSPIAFAIRETKDRGPRTDHGGGENGDDWMDDEQIAKAAAPFRKKWQPILDATIDSLKGAGYLATTGHVEYGEKGHIYLGLTVGK